MALTWITRIDHVNGRPVCESGIYTIRMDISHRFRLYANTLDLLGVYDSAEDAKEAVETIAAAVLPRFTAQSIAQTDPDALVVSRAVPEFFLNELLRALDHMHTRAMTRRERDAVEAHAKDMERVLRTALHCEGLAAADTVAHLLKVHENRPPLLAQKLAHDMVKARYDGLMKVQLCRT